MKLESVALRAFCVRLSAPLATAHGPIRERRGWMIRIEDADGRVGLGEASPLPEFGTESYAECERALVEFARALTAGGLRDAASSEIATVEPALRNAPNTRAGFECALADLEARIAGVDLASHWRQRAGLSGEASREIAVQALIGGATPEAVAEAAAAVRRLGYPACKLKLATSGATSASRGIALDLDLERVGALRETLGPGIRIRLDANEAWSRELALEACQALAVFDIDYLEQPVPRDDLESLAWLDRQAPIAIAADEALLGEGLERCLERAAARILIVKPAAIGGFGAALDLVTKANVRGLRIVWSSLIDAVVSRQAALQLAAALGPDAEIHGLGTGPLLEGDFEAGPALEAGRLRLSARPGLGLESMPSSAARFEGPGPLWTSPSSRFEVAS